MVLGSHASTPRKFLLEETERIFFHITYKIHENEYPMVLSSSKYYLVGVLGGYYFGVYYGYGKCDVVTRTTHLTSHKVDFCIDGGDFVSPRSM